MAAPHPITLDLSTPAMRTTTAYDLEKALVAFLKQLFGDWLMLDNPAVNDMQATMPIAPLPADPDQPPVSFDPVQRAQTLAGKVPPQIVRGRVPRTVTGEIDLSALPDFPSITVQTLSAKVETMVTHVTVRIYFHAYDENPNSQGYQDVLNMIEAAAVALTTFGQAALDQAYPIVMPIEWRLHEPAYFPHFIGEMETRWELPSGRPMPDYQDSIYPPSENITIRPLISLDLPTTPTPPPTAPPQPPVMIMPMGPMYYLSGVTDLLGGTATDLDGQDISMYPDRSLFTVAVTGRGISDWLKTLDATSPVSNTDTGIIVPVNYDPNTNPYVLVRQAGF